MNLNLMKSTIHLNSIPTVKNLLKDIIEKSIEDLCKPNKIVMEVPCVSEAIYIDKDGKKIQINPH